MRGVFCIRSQSWMQREGHGVVEDLFQQRRNITSSYRHFAPPLNCTTKRDDPGFPFWSALLHKQ